MNSSPDLKALGLKFTSDTLEIDTRDPKKPPAIKEPGNAVAVLEKLGFDPLERSTLLWDEISELATEMKDSRAVKKVKGEVGGGNFYSVHAHVNLLTLKQKLLNDLMRYKYTRVPETVDTAPVRQGGLTIVLTKPGDVEIQNGEIYDQAP